MGANFMNEFTATENKKSVVVKKSRKTLMLSEQSVQGNEQSLAINEANNKPPYNIVENLVFA